MPLHRDAAAWPRRPAQLPVTRRPGAVLLGDPADFRIEDVCNPHMAGPGGEPHAVDKARARKQWEALRTAYAGLGVTTHVLPPADGLRDLCFTANPSLALPLPEDGAEAWQSRMTHPARRPEAEHHRRWYERRGWTVRAFPEEAGPVEGGGDGVPHPGRFLLHAGVGPRSTARAWEALAAAHPELDVLLYALHDPRFYHLDTALCALDEEHALYVPEALDEDGRALVRAAFPGAFAVPPGEALRFAANAHCPDGRHVLLERGNPRTEAALRVRGFTPVPLDTSEFRKSGGSVYCLKQACHEAGPLEWRVSPPELA